MRPKTHPALKIIGGRRYMKKRSSLNTKRCELFPPLIRRITTPVHTPYQKKEQESKPIKIFKITGITYNSKFSFLVFFYNIISDQRKYSQSKGRWSTHSSTDSPQEDAQSQYKHKGAPRKGSTKPQRSDQKQIDFVIWVIWTSTWSNEKPLYPPV